MGVIAWMHVVGVSCAEPLWMLSTSSLLSELSYHSITTISQRSMFSLPLVC